MSSSTNPYRLSRRITPTAYRLHLTPDLDAATFSGRVEIDARVHEATTTLVLNAIELVVEPASVSGTTAQVSGPAVLDENYETATFTFPEPLTPGDVTLTLTFTGILNDQLHGFYRSTYTDDDGVEHVIATTQFENCDARRAFPCFDEPSFKATFQSTLTVPSDLAVYSNTAETSRVDNGDGTKTVAFAATMKMSSYLVAFIVGAFEETPAMDVDGVPLRIVYPLGKGHLTELALEAGAFALRFFSSYFAIPYPGDKLDMVAVPDFAMGAMENLGCVTYRLTDLLIDPATASLAEIQRVAEVIHHEIAHMWFGDLVTMDWWQGIWLNEAFATFMQVLCSDSFRPQWECFVNFGVDRDMALQIDGLHATRPIEYEVISPDDTQGMFDLLTYEKGGSVLRMLQQYLGPDTFRDGIRHYLAKHAYANTVTTDLWDALEEVSGQPVRDVMNTWILQGGYPLVTFENGQLRQEPFSYGPVRTTSAIGSTWLVPVFTRSLDSTDRSRHLLADVPVPVGEEGAVVVNAGGSGVFRTRYGDAELARVASRIGELEELERATLIADSWALLLSAKTSWSSFLEAARGLGDHDEPTPWGTIASGLDMVHRALPEHRHEELAATVRELFTPQFERLGWDPTEADTERTPQLRAVIIGALGTLGGDEGIRLEARRRFEANELDKDLARTILRIVARDNRRSDFEAFVEGYRNAPTPQAQQRFLLGWASFTDEALALDAAEKCFTEVRSQDAASVLGLLSGANHSGPAVWRYLTTRWEDAAAKFPSSTLYHVTRGIPSFITDEGFAKEVEAFHAAHPLGAQQRTVNQYIERMYVGLTFTAAIRAQF